MKLGAEIKGVIFDVDGVLIDSMAIWTDLGARYVRSRGAEPEEGLAKILFSMSMEQGAAYLKDHYLPESTVEEIRDGLSKMLRDFYFYEVQAKPGAKELLEKMKTAHMRITAATSSPRGHVEAALERNGLLIFMERIFTSAEVGSSKHSPEIYDAAADFMGLKRDEICVFEDSLYALRTAAKAGYHTVGVFDKDGESDQKGMKETAGLYVGSLGELMQRL
ncbi:MAG: HAD family phosphatase [Lachnospiraceae bacterium]|nr:HAD family phosphatase [Lachnospiraceae bacterium]